MATIANSRLHAVWAVLLTASAVAGAQAYTPPPPPLIPGPCVPTKDFPCDPPAPPKASSIPAAADKFPFPGENPGNGNPPAPPPAAPDTANPSGAAKPSTAQQFPFPGEPAAPAPAGSPQPATSGDHAFPGEPSDSSSSSSGSSTSDSTPLPDDAAAADHSPLKDAGSHGSTRFERRKLAVPEDLDHREQEDLDVAHFYLTTGNYPGSYLRAQDAVKLYPDDELAHFALAQSAEKLKKTAEAIAEYKKYLELAPDGEKAKQAKRALEDLPGR